MTLHTLAAIESLLAPLLRGLFQTSETCFALWLVFLLATLSCSLLAQHNGDGLGSRIDLRSTLATTVKLSMLIFMHYVCVGH